MPKATINGVRLNFEETGAGEPVLLLMGFGDSVAAWSEQVPALAERHRVIALDHRGTGDSDSPADGYSILRAHVCMLGMAEHVERPCGHTIVTSYDLPTWWASHHYSRRLLLRSCDR